MVVERGIVKRKFVTKIIWLLKLVEWIDDEAIDKGKWRAYAENACLGSTWKKTNFKN